jgi:hypothetical protein
MDWGEEWRRLFDEIEYKPFCPRPVEGDLTRIQDSETKRELYRLMYDVERNRNRENNA